ncbi:hypothetical protein CARUB_v10007419mg [Capsella rubella]|uniref:MBD domain-containing protein n=1 Tax=Capsella rubella TaxID=81985 RepID=R0FAP2_9BRAS|nr:methyl-CpG-binding domain-containing protein 1 [Capsella rubella]EOA18806.1 hypothetical protein CARUB_v10007419mg [Capsella rubella]
MDAKSTKLTTRKREASTSSKRGTIDTYAVQCETCLKWRKLDNQEEYEELRSRIHEEKFVCNQKEGMSCEDDARELRYDTSRTWSIDKNGLPKTPRGFKRMLIMRKDYSRWDAYYVAPTGKKFKTRAEIEAFIEANQEYKYATLGDFNFIVPRVVRDTVPSGIPVKNPKPSKKSV